MHPIQAKILALVTTKNLASLTLREIGELIGENHPQIVKHHINQLFKKGYLKESSDKKSITRLDQYNSREDKFISVPILGSANCGEALLLAEENLQGYIQVSKSVISKYDPNNMFALKAVGNSMNKADIHGLSIENGDYVIIDKRINDGYQNKYVLSVINGMANIKKFIADEDRDRILLISESTQDLAPIVIHRNDFESYLVNGEVIQVIKKS